jgi:hypothetical protein
LSKTGWFLRKTERFFAFNIILHVDEFCIMRYFDFLNSVLTKNFKIDSSLFGIFISKK